MKFSSVIKGMFYKLIGWPAYHKYLIKNSNKLLFSIFHSSFKAFTLIRFLFEPWRILSRHSIPDACVNSVYRVFLIFLCLVYSIVYCIYFKEQFPVNIGIDFLPFLITDCSQTPFPYNIFNNLSSKVFKN